MNEATGSTPNTRSEEMPHGEGRLVSERPGPAEQSGTSGVSDTRRVQLERMEAEAGTQHEAADESVPQEREAQNSGAGLKPDLASGRPSQSSVNPDIDKR